jgi:hypothetical protein
LERSSLLRAVAELGEPEVPGRLLGDVTEQLVGDLGKGVVHEVVAARVLVWECHRFGEALAVDGDDALDERLPGEAVLVDVANEVPARVAFPEPDGLPAAVDAGGAARLVEEPCSIERELSRREVILGSSRSEAAAARAWLPGRGSPPRSPPVRPWT